MISRGAGANGRLFCPLINVAYQLRDARPEDGGFCLIPGAHKAVLGPGAWPGPGDAFTMSNRQGVGLSVDIDAMLASGHLQHVEMAAGDILIFPSAASVHVRPSSAQLPSLPPCRIDVSELWQVTLFVGLWVSSEL